jgi:hypothetical protein
MDRIQREATNRPKSKGKLEKELERKERGKSRAVRHRLTAKTLLIPPPHPHSKDDKSSKQKEHILSIQRRKKSHHKEGPKRGSKSMKEK